MRDYKMEYRELEAKINVLEEENIFLSERAEDILLLGQVAERINHLGEPEEILDVILERIAIFKDIPYCACCKLENDSVRLIQAYALFTYS